MIARGASLGDVLDDLCGAIDAQDPTIISTVLLMDADGRMYYAEPQSPGSNDLRLIEEAGHIALIALEAERSQAVLQKALVEIKKSEDQLRTIIETIPVQAWRGLPDGSIDYLNQRWHEYTGLSPEEAHAGRNNQNLLPGTLPGPTISY